MPVIVENGATEAHVKAVIREIETMGYHGISIPGIQRTAVCIVGNQGTAEDSRLLALEGVKETIHVTKPFKLVSRETHPQSTIIPVGDIMVGDKQPVVMAGPCATGLAIITEATDYTNIELVEQYADIIQIGARNMQNYSLLHRAGRATKPVLLKRGLAATIEELLMSAECIMAEGNTRIILCERGIRTFSDNTRNTLDLSAVLSIKESSHLPVLVDPSHAAGRRDYVIPLSRAAIAVGADGILVEVHSDPLHALSDGMQSLYQEQFATFMKEIRSLTG